MKLSLSLFLALAGSQSALAASMTCGTEQEYVNAELVGQKYTQDIANTLENRPIRVLHPDDIVTADFNDSRLNIWVDGDDIILRSDCS